MKKHVNIPIFIPHLACPNDCAFCNQRSISDTAAAPEPQQVREIIKRAVGTIDRTSQSCEIAFFGGSFTGIGEQLMRAYLSVAAEFADVTDGIRLSTRPDYIDRHILDILKEYGVTSVELGMQSMNDAVLTACGRGHTAQDTATAANLVREYGFELVLQMMTGLPGDTDDGALETAALCADLNPDAVRIYPCIVLKGTRLSEMFRCGKYAPPSLENTVELCSRLMLFFEKRGISVLRVGLFSEYNMISNAIVAGPYHPAFGELCENRIYLNIMEAAASDLPAGGRIRFLTAPGETSKAVGQKRCNIEALIRSYGFAQVQVGCDAVLVPRQIRAVILE